MEEEKHWMLNLFKPILTFNDALNMLMFVHSLHVLIVYASSIGMERKNRIFPHIIRKP